MNDLSSINNFEQQENSEEKKTGEVINWLFRELREIFRAFTFAWPTQDDYQSAKRIWLKVFMLAGINTVEQIQHGLNKCYLMTKPYVPNPGEFVEWCKPSAEDLGLPDVHKAFEICVFLNQAYSNNNHNHIATNTVLKHVIKQIGASKLRTLSEKEGYKLFGHYYTVACREYVEGIIQDILPAIEQKKEPPADNSPRDRRGFKERMAEYQQRLDEAKLNCAGKTYKEFDEKAITPGGMMFDQQIYDEFKAYLLSIPEEMTVILPPRYAYRRSRFVSTIEQPELMRKAGYNPNPQGKEEVQRSGQNKPFRPYKNYQDD
jgi:hypothetical protein